MFQVGTAKTASHRDITVVLDVIDAIYVVSALAEVEERWRDHADGTRSFIGRAERCRRVREAIEAAVYGSVA